MDDVPKKRSTKTKRSGSAEPEQIKLKKTKLSKTELGIIGKFATESTLYYKPSFMFMVGKGLLFKLHGEYKLYKVVYKPFIIAVAPEIFPIFLDEILERHAVQKPPKAKEELKTVETPKNFKKKLKMAKLEVLFQTGITDLEGLQSQAQHCETVLQKI